MTETQVDASVQTGSANNVPAGGAAGETQTGVGTTPQTGAPVGSGDKNYEELEKKFGQQGAELGEYRTFIQQIAPLLNNLESNPEFAKAIADGKIDDKLMKAVVAGKVKIEEAQAAVQAHEQVKTDMGKQAYTQANPEEIQKRVTEVLTEQMNQRFKDAEDIKDFEENVNNFVANTPDFKEYADDINNWLASHTDQDDIEVAYYAVKGLKLAEASAKAAGKASGEGAKQVAQNAGGGNAPSGGQINPQIDAWDRLVAPTSDPNRIR